MRCFSHLHHRSARLPRLVGTVCGGLVLGLPTLPLVAVAQSINPCPQIYYEEPFNSTRSVPQGCPPNAATQELLDGQGATNQVTPPATLPSNIPAAQPPLPETQQRVVATVTPVNGSVSIRLVNTMGTGVTYQVIGDTNDRSLLPGSEITLQSLPTPVNVTFVRPDGGFVEVTPQTTGSGQLDVLLREAATVDLGTGILNVQEDGSVLLN